jgi:MerR family transcriptional regulator, mercuric resistance operon regulatory protein
MRISDLARETGCHLETVRYYERIGLIPPPNRSASGYRSYQAEDVDRLRFIVRSRALGFGLDEIRSLLDLARGADAPCDDVDRLARIHLAEVEEKQRELTALADQLRELIETCGQGTRASCVILKSLGAPISGAHGKGRDSCC